MNWNRLKGGQFYGYISLKIKNFLLSNTFSAWLSNIRLDERIDENFKTDLVSTIRWSNAKTLEFENRTLLAPGN